MKCSSVKVDLGFARSCGFFGEVHFEVQGTHARAIFSTWRWVVVSDAEYVRRELEKCARKPRHLSAMLAMNVLILQSLAGRPVAGLYPYACPWCGDWHLTRSKPRALVDDPLPRLR